MTTRRSFVSAAAALCGSPLWSKPLDSKERVNRALKGTETDRPAFSLWHHFGLKSAESHASRTLQFHRAYRTDIVKVMSDFPYPKPKSTKWWELRPEENPYPDEIRALELIRDGLAGKAYFVETIFNSWNVAEKLSSKEEVRRLKKEDPGALLAAIDTINNSQIKHAKRALATGASGILLAVANANEKELSKDDYLQFSEAFDRKLLNTVSDAKLNVLHLHVDRPLLDAVTRLPAPVVNYSLHATGIPIAEIRKRFSASVVMGGVDERAWRGLTKDEVRQQVQAARQSSGPRYLASPGCSVPDESRPEELVRFVEALEA